MAGKSGKRKKSENLSAETQTNISINTPSIPFDKPKKSKEKSDNEGNSKKIEVPIEPGKKNSKTIEKKVPLFGDSDMTPKVWVKWRIELKEIIRDCTTERQCKGQIPANTVDSGHREHSKAGRTKKDSKWNVRNDSNWSR